MTMTIPYNFFQYLLRHDQCTPKLAAYARGRKAEDIEFAIDGRDASIRRMVASVRKEVHMLRGFVRLTAYGAYASYGYLKPRHDVGELVAELLARRYPHTVIILGNAYHSWMCLYGTEGVVQTEGPALASVLASLRDMLGCDSSPQSSEALWEVYYRSQYREKRRNLPYFRKSMTDTLRRSAHSIVESNTNGASTLDAYCSDDD
ncbi:MAG: DUF4130 domain-containing protein [Candidatus Methanofastidiosa archaeon]|nr:DUF4130 domain-containing protein [Candidatus Methanofastidiosa archaeon]